jgi:uncharacterized protein (DUF2141 family)
VIHDENRNGEHTMFGIPKEGYGFSSGAKVTMSAPSFSDAVYMMEDICKCLYLFTIKF